MINRIGIQRTRFSGRSEALAPVRQLDGSYRIGATSRCLLARPDRFRISSWARLRIAGVFAQS
jgi:hypothetical protein